MKTRAINSLAAAFNQLKTTVCVYYRKGKRLEHTFNEHLTREQVEQRMLMQFHIPARCIQSVTRTGANDDVAILPSTWVQPVPANWENTIEANLARASILETCPV